MSPRLATFHKFQKGLIHFGVLTLIVFLLIATAALISKASPQDDLANASSPVWQKIGLTQQNFLASLCTALNKAFPDSGRNCDKNSYLYSGYVPVEWYSENVFIRASSLTIKIGNQIFTGKGEITKLASNKIDANTITFEVEWEEKPFAATKAITMKVYMLFKRDGQNWIVKDLRTYNGADGVKKQVSWIYYTPFAQAPLDQFFYAPTQDAKAYKSAVGDTLDATIYFENIGIFPFFEEDTRVEDQREFVEAVNDDGITFEDPNPVDNQPPSQIPAVTSPTSSPKLSPSPSPKKSPSPTPRRDDDDDNDD